MLVLLELLMVEVSHIHDDALRAGCGTSSGDSSRGSNDDAHRLTRVMSEFISHWRTWGLIVCAAAIGISLLVGISLSSAVVRPLKRISHVMQELGQPDASDGSDKL